MAVQRIARAAGIIMIGSVLSRIVGLGREVVIASLFGVGGRVDAFTAASQIATIFYDLLISGMVSAALVPVLSEYAAPERRAEMGRILGIIMTGAVIVLVGGIVLLQVFAAPLVHYIADCSPNPCPATEGLALSMTHVTLLAVLFMGISAVLMSAHYALHRFVYPSFAMSSLNVAIIVAAIAGSWLLDVQSLAIGLVLGAVLMVVIQWPGLRDIPIRPSLNFRHPAVVRILKLYAPIAVSLVVSQVVLLIDRRFAFETGEGSVSAMRYGTTLIQFALGIVGAAISLAALPSLSQHFSNRDEAAYRRTLGAGLRLVTVLALPASAALFFLAIPLVSVVFLRGAFNEGAKWLTVLALLCYVPGLPGATLNQVLIFGFYSRKNTVIPVTVGIVGAGVYLGTALALKGAFGMAGLVVANSAQLTFNALVTGLLLYRALGGLRGQVVGSTALKSALGAVLLGVVSFAAWGLLTQILGARSNLIVMLLELAVPGLLGGLAYVATLYYLKVGELQLILDLLTRRLPGRRGQAGPPGAVAGPALPAATNGDREAVVLDDAVHALGLENQSTSLDSPLVSVDLGGPTDR